MRVRTAALHGRQSCAGVFLALAEKGGAYRADRAVTHKARRVASVAILNCTSQPRLVVALLWVGVALAVWRTGASHEELMMIGDLHMVVAGIFFRFLVSLEE